MPKYLLLCKNVHLNLFNRTIMKFKQILILSLLPCALCCCSGKNGSVPKASFADKASGDMESYVNEDVNGIVQALPRIIIIPGDQTLDDHFCLRRKVVDGKTYFIRDYKNYFMKDEGSKVVYSYIQSLFVKNGYPLEDLELALKNFETQEAVEMASGLATDARTALLTSIKPDIVLELDYSSKISSSNYKEKNISYTLKALDSYSAKSIAVVEAHNITGTDVVETLKKDLSKGIPGLMNDVQMHFSDLLTRGRAVNVTINVAEGSNQNLQDENIEGDTYADQIIDFIKVNAVKGAYTMQVNTKNKLTFGNVRIKMLNDDGTQYGVYDFTRDLQKYLKRNLGLSSTNDSQGLEEVILTIRGL